MPIAYSAVLGLGCSVQYADGPAHAGTAQGPSRKGDTPLPPLIGPPGHVPRACQHVRRAAVRRWSLLWSSKRWRILGGPTAAQTCQLIYGGGSGERKRWLAVPTILEHLTYLTVEELDVVISKAKALRQFAKTGESGLLSAPVESADPVPVRAHSTDYVLAILCQVCKDMGRDTRGVAQAKRSSMYASFQKAVPDVIKFIQQHVRNRAVETALLKLAYRHMAEEGGWGLVQLMARTHSIPSAIDAIFPGYYRAGLMPIAMQRLEGQRG